MRRYRPLLPPLLAALALLASACGGSSSSSSAAGSSGGASVAPASAPVFVSVETDSDSAQWKQAEGILNKFPGKARLIAAIEKGLRGQGLSYADDIEPALGNEVDVVVLGFDSASKDVVAMTKPKDDAKLKALLAKLDAKSSSSRKTVTAGYKGWTLVADSQAAIDAFESEAGKGALADDATFKEAMAKEPGNALVKAYASGAALQGLLDRFNSRLGGPGCGSSKQTLRFVEGALSAESSGIRLHATIKTDNGPQGAAATAELLSQIPSGALLVLDLHGSPGSLAGVKALQGCGGQVQKSLGGLEQVLGVKLSDLGALFKKESALYVRTGSPLPEVTFVAQQDDPKQAFATIDALTQKLGGLAGAAPESTTVDGVPAKKIVVAGRVTIYYAALDGEIVVSDSETGIRDLRSSGPKLEDDPTFQDAKKASGLPDATSLFLYVDLQDSIPLIESLVQLAGTSIRSDVDANLRPLKSFVLYGSGTGGESDLGAFLEVK